MKKNQILKILIPIMAVLLILQILSGLLPLFLPYPFHRITGILFVTGVGLHILLNWSWIRTSYFKK